MKSLVIINMKWSQQPPYHQRNPVTPSIETTHEVHTPASPGPPEQSGYGGGGGQRSEVLAHELPSNDLLVCQLDEINFNRSNGLIDIQCSNIIYSRDEYECERWPITSVIYYINI